MSLIKAIPQVLERKRVRRWVTIVPADEAWDCPAMRWNVGYVDASLSEGFQKMLRNTKNVNSVEDKKFKEFKRNVVTKMLDPDNEPEDGKLWEGVTTRNVMRICPKFMTHPELLPSVEEMPVNQEWNFDKDDLSVIAEEMEPSIFSDTLTEAQDLQEYAREGFEQAKK